MRTSPLINATHIYYRSQLRLWWIFLIGALRERQHFNYWRDRIWCAPDGAYFIEYFGTATFCNIVADDWHYPKHTNLQLSPFDFDMITYIIETAHLLPRLAIKSRIRPARQAVPVHKRCYVSYFALMLSPRRGLYWAALTQQLLAKKITLAVTSGLQSLYALKFPGIRATAQPSAGP